MQLPIGWEYVQLNDLCDKVSLNKIKIKQKDYLLEGDIPVVDQGQDLIGGYFNDENLIVPGMPPFIIFGDHTQVKKYINFQFIAGADGVKVLKAKENINPKYLFYHLHTIDIGNKGYARHFQIVEKSNFIKAPTEQQDQIVSKIEELFSKLDKGIETLKTAQQQLKVYRQAVLKWAFADSLINDNITDGDLPDEWEIKSLKDLKVFSIYGPRFSSQNYSSDGVAILRTSDIDSKGKIDWLNAPKLLLTDAEYEKYKLIKGDLLVTRTGSIGTISVFNDNKKAIPGAFLIHYRLKSDYNVWFIYYFLKSTKAQNHFKKYSFGVGRPNLNVPNIELLEMKIPSFQKQNKIVEEIESRLSVCNKIEEIISNSLKEAEALRQSILKQAFEGKLI